MQRKRTINSSELLKFINLNKMKKLRHLKFKTIIVLLLFAPYLIQAQDTLSNSVNHDFSVTKGRYLNALTFSLDQRRAENENQLLRQVIDQNKYDFEVRASGGYAIKDNLVLGLALAYGETKEDVVFLDENNLELNTKSLQRGFSFVPNMRNYIPIGNGQLQIIVQTELRGTFGESLRRTYSADNVDKIEGNFLEFDLGVSPGVVLFFTRNWALETRVNVAGISTRFEEKVINNDFNNKTKIQETSIDLRLNLLQLNLGVAYYF
jgi:hypothetical protein